MADIRVEVDTSALDEALEVLGPKVGARAVARAINKTVTATQSAVVKELSTQIGLPQKTLRPQVRVRRVGQALAGRVASGRQGVIGRGARLRGEVRASGSDISLMAFRARKAGKGVSFKPGRNARRTRVHHAFIQKMPSGKEAVFLRTRHARNVLVAEAEQARRTRRMKYQSVRSRTKGSDLAISKLTLPGVSAAMFDDALQASLQNQTSDRLAKELEESVSFELGRATGRIPARRRRRRNRRTASGRS